MYVVRHAEKEAEPPQDPPLSPEGRARSRALADVLSPLGVEVIFTTPYRRTRETAAPLAERLGVEVLELAVGPDPDAYARRQAERILAEHPGRSVLVVSHSNTVPLIVRALGGEEVGELGDGDYDDLFVVLVPPTGPTRTAARQYGRPDGSTPAPGGAPVPGRAPAPAPAARPGGSAMAPPRPAQSVADVIRKVIEARGVETAVQAYGDLRQFSSRSYDFSEGELERLGEEYLAGGEALTAAVVFALNANTYPESARAQVHLGDALRAAGRPAPAAAAYRKALELDPGNEAAARGLRELSGS